MAGSLNHLIDDNTGEFKFDTIENLGDAHEACEECFYIIAELLDAYDDDYEKLKEICSKLHYPVPKIVPKKK